MNFPEIWAASRLRFVGWTVIWVLASLLWCSPARPKTWRNCWWTIPIPLCWLFKASYFCFWSYRVHFELFCNNELIFRAWKLNLAVKNNFKCINHHISFISSRPKAVVGIIGTWRWFQVDSSWRTIDHTEIGIASCDW